MPTVVDEGTESNRVETPVTSNAVLEELARYYNNQLLQILFHAILTGTKDLLTQFDASQMGSSDPLVSAHDDNECRKDLGEKEKLRHQSRGHVFVVRSCGHIDISKPIYK